MALTKQSLRQGVHVMIDGELATKEELRELAAVQKELTQAINALKDAMSSSNEQAETRVELAEKELALAENRV